MGVLSQACSEYPEQHVYNIFATCKENVKDEVDFLPADKIDQNNKFAISLQYRKK